MINPEAITDQKLEALTERVKFLERALMLMLNSAGYYQWSPDQGITLTDRAHDDDVPRMIAGSIPWDPQSLDKGG